MRPHQELYSAPVVFENDILDDYVSDNEPIMNPDPYRVMPTGIVRDNCWRISAKLQLGYTCSPCFIMNGVYCRAVIDKPKSTGHCGLFIQLAQDVPGRVDAITLKGRLDVWGEKGGSFQSGPMIASQDFHVQLGAIGDAWGSSYMFSLSHIERFQHVLIDFSRVISGYQRRPEITHYNNSKFSNLAILDSRGKEVIFYADKKVLETLIPSINNIAQPAWNTSAAYDSGPPRRRQQFSSWSSSEEGYHSSRTSSMTSQERTSKGPNERRRYNRPPPPIPTAAEQAAAAIASAAARQRQGDGWSSGDYKTMEKWILKPSVSQKAFLELLDCVYNNTLPEIIHIIRAEEFLNLCRDNNLVHPYQRYVENLRGLMMRGIAPELLIKMLPIRAPETFTHVGHIIVTTVASQWGTIPTKTKERLASYIKDPSGLFFSIILLLSGSSVPSDRDS